MSGEAVICQFCRESSASSERKMFFKQKIDVEPMSFIFCEQCIELLYTSVKKLKVETSGKNPTEPKFKRADYSSRIFPKDIYSFLCESIIGQEEAKKAIAVAVYQHFERSKDPSLTHKSNVMLIGPTGSGKTELARSVATFLKVPFAHLDMTTITPRGYVGDSPEVCVEKLLTAAGGDPKLAERGIIFLDEFDKLTSTGEIASFKSRLVQGEMLTLIEGALVEIAAQGEPNKKISIDTSKILFIAAGSFAGLEAFVNADSQNLISMSSNAVNQPIATNKNFGSNLKNKHFESFGLIPEILGRFPVMCFTSALTRKELCQILTEPKNSILGHYQALFQAAGVELSIDEECLLEIADKASSEGLGARGIKKHLELKLQDLIFEIDAFKGKNVLVQKDGIVTSF
jgi:ATP-dependent Clp protease ATP-binding subunit ClpX